MNKQTELNDILNDVDEPEESLDTPEAEPEPSAAAPEPQEEPKTEPEPSEPQPQAADTPKPEGGDEDLKGLPPWMHARLKGEQEKVGRERERAEALEKQLQEAQGQLQQFQTWYQQQAGRQQPTVADALSQIERSQASQSQQMKVAFSKRLAAKEFGEDVVEEAFKWGVEEANRNPQFNQTLWGSAEPAYDVVKAYRAAQGAAELEKYGGDVDALVQARMAAASSQHQPAAGAPGETPNSPQPAQAMPSNFSTGPGASGGRGQVPFVGPKPLSELLK